jgi:hypothetical protein
MNAEQKKEQKNPKPFLDAYASYKKWRNRLIVFIIIFVALVAYCFLHSSKIAEFPGWPQLTTLASLFPVAFCLIKSNACLNKSTRLRKELTGEKEETFFIDEVGAD